MNNDLQHTDGGLMAKSQGDYYPLVVSGLGPDLWYVWNAKTGKASLTLYTRAKDAVRYAEHCCCGGLPLPGATASRTIDDLIESGDAVVRLDTHCTMSYTKYMEASKGDDNE